MIVLWITLIALAVVLLAGLLYWLFIVTEGVYLGRRIVVWLYDITAHKYDHIKEFDDEAEQFFLARPLHHHLRHQPAPLILDVATGTGRLPHYLLGVPTFHGRVVGLEPSRRMVSRAAEKLAGYGPRAVFVRQTAVPLPFANDTFDAVTCLEALEFLPSDQAALREMVRVLRPGGLLMVTRRRGWEAKAFIGRYHDVAGFEDMMKSLGLFEVNTQPWQIDYDQVFGIKPQ